MYSFDTAFREAKKQGAAFELYGEAYHLPASMPVGAILEVQRMELMTPEEQANEQANVVELFDRVFGASKRLNAPEDWKLKPGHTDVKGTYHPGSLVRFWLDCGLTVDEMTAMLKWAFAQYAPPANPTPALEKGHA